MNIYGNNGNPYAYAAGVYSYPRDIEIIKQRIAWLKQDWDAAFESLELGVGELGKNPKFIPFYIHRYILSNGKPSDSIVCSIHGSDAIVYGSNLKEYLKAEFLT